MPIYEYQCQACGHELEALQKMADEPLVDCPECSESALKKKISAVAFRLKGAGWYETDFKTGDKKNLAGGGDSADKSDKSDKGNKSDKGGSASSDSSANDSKSSTSSGSKATEGKKSA